MVCGKEFTSEVIHQFSNWWTQNRERQTFRLLWLRENWCQGAWMCGFVSVAFFIGGVTSSADVQKQELPCLEKDSW